MYFLRGFLSCIFNCWWFSFNWSRGNEICCTLSCSRNSLPCIEPENSLRFSQDWPPTWAMTLYACDTFHMPSKCLVEMWHVLVSILHVDSATTFSVCVLQAALCALTEEGFSVKQVKHRHFMQVLCNLPPSLSQQQIDWYRSYKMSG